MPQANNNETIPFITVPHCISSSLSASVQHSRALRSALCLLNYTNLQKMTDGHSLQSAGTPEHRTEVSSALSPVWFSPPLVPTFTSRFLSRGDTPFPPLSLSVICHSRFFLFLLTLTQNIAQSERGIRLCQCVAACTPEMLTSLPRCLR